MKLIVLFAFVSIAPITNLLAAESSPTPFSPMYSMAFAHLIDHTDPKLSVGGVLGLEGRSNEWRRGDEFKQHDLMIEERNKLVKIMSQKNLLTREYSIKLIGNPWIGKYDFKTHSFPLANASDISGILVDKYLGRGITGIQSKHVTTLIFKNAPSNLEIEIDQEKAREIHAQFGNQAVSIEIIFTPSGMKEGFGGSANLYCVIKWLLIKSKNDNSLLATFKEGKLIASK